MRSRLTFLNPGALFPEAARHLLHAVGRRFRDGRCAQVAASLAFTTLLSLVPFVTLVAVLGTTISPYLFFWQAAQEVEGRRHGEHTDEEVRRELARIKALWDYLRQVVEANRDLLMGRSATVVWLP